MKTLYKADILRTIVCALDVGPDTFFDNIYYCKGIWQSAREADMTKVYITNDRLRVELSAGVIIIEKET
jgi:hypothetical protein